MLIDDVGSFPFPPDITSEVFAKNYFTFYKYLAEHDDIPENRGFQNNFVNPLTYTFQRKLETGLDVVNYPQLFDMHDQFMKPIKQYEKESYLIDPRYAIVSEIKVLDAVAKRWYEETGRPVWLKACVTGPIELYLRTEFGFTVYEDILANLAKSLNAFARNCLVNKPHLQTKVIAIDEPSLGFVEFFNTSPDGLAKTLDIAAGGLSCDVQVHLHSLAAAEIPAGTRGITTLTCEFASNNSNVVAKELLEQHDKFIRVGICRTNFNSIVAERLDAGETYEAVMAQPETLIDSEAAIRKNLLLAKKHYGDRLTYVGPDCGLRSWGPPDLAASLLKRVVKVAREEGVTGRT
jgi:5-methyltetrahydropteroyltriglutamate--homocysteine methyltransferase